ncbi:MAG: hypothetical protein ACHQD6_03625 [Steroidobacterales bacterium]|jgi:tetratricopeptide (TPR) repeat protein
MAHVPMTLSEWARGARLYDGLGSFHRAITTGSPAAQQYFDQGMRFLWAFNHDESARSFAKAAQLDPACASCYWGVALTVGPNYNVPAMEEPRAKVAFEALHHAQENAAHASAVEQALISALAARYPSAQPLDPSNLAPVLSAHADFMRTVAARFPDDLDVQTLCAESEMNVHAWRLWTADGQPVPGTLAIVSRLESVLKRDPMHPGANHYYVHVMEASQHPERATASAMRLTGMMPAAGHLEHMPAHIMQRIGRYEEAAAANRRGVAADRAYFAGTAAPDYYAMYLAHNYSFLAVSAAMEGRKSESLAAVQSVVQVVPLDMALGMGDSGWMLSQPYSVLVRFGLWDELIALGPPDQRAPGLTGAWLFGRSVALAARGRIAEAQTALTGLHTLRASVPAEARAGLSSLQDILAVAEPIAAARIAASQHNSNAAIAQLEKAVAGEDQLAYDEPADWFFPVRQLLGAELLSAGRAADAERVYREDLQHNPRNGWSLYGMSLALKAQGKSQGAARLMREYEAAWKYADIRLPGSAFWFAGPDTLSCECQRVAAAQPGARLD